VDVVSALDIHRAVSESTGERRDGRGSSVNLCQGLHH